MSYYVGFAVKMVIRQELRQEFGKVFDSSDWLSANDPVLRWIEGLPGCSKNPLPFLVNGTSSKYDPKTGHWEIRYEWNHYGLYDIAYDYLRHTIIPYLADHIIEVETYMEDESPDWEIDDFAKRDIEDRIESRPLSTEGNETLMKWAKAGL